MDKNDLKLFELDGISLPNGEKKVIDRGAYGCVFEVTSSCAAKEVHQTFINLDNPVELQAVKRSFLQECVQCSKLFHPNIVQFLGVYYPSENAVLPWLVMEKMDTSLAKYLDDNKVDEVPFSNKISILHDVVLGLRYLHTLDIVHRDLSSNNILLTKSCIAKIADLGVAKMIDPKLAQTRTQAPGTAIFMPPEALQFSSHYGKPVDIFSFGCVSLHVMSHEWPVPKPETFIDEKTHRKIALLETERRDIYITKFQGPPELKILVLKCLSDVAKERPEINEVNKVIKEIAPELQEETLLSKFNEQVSEFQVQRIQLEETIAQVSAEKDRVEKQARDDVIQANKERNQYKEQISQLEMNIAFVRAEKERLEQQALTDRGKLHKDLANATEKTRQFKERAIHLEEIITRDVKKEQLTQQCLENTVLNGQLAQARKKISQYEGKIKELEMQIEGQRKSHSRPSLTEPVPDESGDLVGSLQCMIIDNHSHIYKRENKAIPMDVSSRSLVETSTHGTSSGVKKVQDYIRNDPLKQIFSVHDGSNPRQFYLDCIEELFKFSMTLGGAMIFYIGYGEKGTGNWYFKDGSVTFQDIFFLYKKYFKGKLLYIVSDCCYSGQWVVECAKCLDEMGIGACGHQTRKFGMLLKVFASCQPCQKATSERFLLQGIYFNNDTNSTHFYPNKTLSDAQTTYGCDFTDIRCMPKSGPSPHCHLLNLPPKCSWMWKDVVAIEYKDQQSKLIYTVHGKDKGKDIWYYILVKSDLEEKFKALYNTGRIDVAKYGQIVKSGSGKQPPRRVIDSIVQFKNFACVGIYCGNST